MEAELRAMPISTICVPQPANQPARLLYLQSCCTALSNPFFSLLSLLPFPFNPSRSCCTVLSNPVLTDYSLSFHVSLRFVQVNVFHVFLLVSMLALLNFFLSYVSLTFLLSLVSTHLSVSVAITVPKFLFL